MTTGLGSLLDLRYDVQEVDLITQFHSAKCPGLTNATDWCNFVADGANLCAQAHSKTWWNFVHCMYGHVDPKGDQDGDVHNPLAHVETFDAALANCTDRLEDYSPADLRTCVYGAEAAALRNASATKTAADLAAGRPPVVWVDVDGEFVQAPANKSDDRSTWKAALRTAICGELVPFQQDERVAPVWHAECSPAVAV